MLAMSCLAGVVLFQARPWLMALARGVQAPSGGWQSDSIEKLLWTRRESSWTMVRTKIACLPCLVTSEWKLVRIGKV